MRVSAPLQLLWMEVKHPSIGYYDALQRVLEQRGHNVTEWQVHRRGRPLDEALHGMQVALVAFGWFQQESGALRTIPEFHRATCAAARVPTTPSTAQASRGTRPGACWCGRVRVVVLLNKEYVLMRQKLAWLRDHCVDHALTVHHDAAVYAANTSVPFTRIWFGVNVSRFSLLPPAADGLLSAHSRITAIGREKNRSSSSIRTVASSTRGALAAEQGNNTSHTYLYDIGFTGVIRAEQTGQWRLRIWREAWPRLQAGGLRLYSGNKGGVHQGVAHAALDLDEYVQRMRASKMWLSTTGPADLVGTRYFEVMATGTTLCVCNRMENAIVYSSLGIKEGVHVVMFSTLREFEAVVRNFSMPEHEARRLAIVRRAQALATRKFSWDHVGARVEGALQPEQAATRHNGKTLLGTAAPGGPAVSASAAPGAASVRAPAPTPLASPLDDPSSTAMFLSKMGLLDAVTASAATNVASQLAPARAPLASPLDDATYLAFLRKHDLKPSEADKILHAANGGGAEGR